MEEKRISIESVIEIEAHEEDWGKARLDESEIKVAKEILNIFSANEYTISLATDVLEFCKTALKYNAVNEFI